MSRPITKKQWLMGSLALVLISVLVAGVWVYVILSAPPSVNYDDILTFPDWFDWFIYGAVALIYGVAVLDVIFTWRYMWFSQKRTKGKDRIRKCSMVCSGGLVTMVLLFSFLWFMADWEFLLYWLLVYAVVWPVLQIIFGLLLFVHRFQ